MFELPLISDITIHHLADPSIVWYVYISLYIIILTNIIIIPNIVLYMLKYKNVIDSNDSFDVYLFIFRKLI